MWDDPIVKQTRAVREKLVADFGGDLNALWKHLQSVQAQYQDRVVTGQRKPPVLINRKVS
jgi:hypothetical protein